jgi:8-oxo-dGTP diphosphatase
MILLFILPMKLKLPVIMSCSSNCHNMKKIAAIILENDKSEILLYLRDSKPGIPFPNHWDLIGGHVEDGETPEEALVREVKEELNIDLNDYSFYKKYECLQGDAYENTKFIYTGKINLPIEEITLIEGERPQFFSREEIPDVKFANILRSIVMEYIKDTNQPVRKTT